MDGDNLLSGFELKLWRLQQDIIFKWGTFTLFRWDRVNVPYQLPEMVTWFIPRDSSYCFEISQYVEKELKSLEREDVVVCGQNYPGCSTEIRIMEFSGVEPYVEDERIKELAENLLNSMMAKIRKGNEQGNEQAN